MTSKFTSTLKDTLGIIRALGYRTFIERQWKKPQPMFNVLQVKETEVDLFKEFLNKSLVVSLKFDTPLSLGPFFSEKTKTFIYITHYASTKAFMNVCTGLVTAGLSAKRAKATNETNWTYCKSSEKKSFAIISDIIMIGVDGNESSFLDYLRLKGLEPEAQVKKIKDVRGKGLSNYYFFKDDSVTLNLLRDYIKLDGGAIVYQAKKLS